MWPQHAPPGNASPDATGDDDTGEHEDERVGQVLQQLPAPSTLNPKQALTSEDLMQSAATTAAPCRCVVSCLRSHTQSLRVGKECCRRSRPSRSFIRCCCLSTLEYHTVVMMLLPLPPVCKDVVARSFAQPCILLSSINCKKFQAA